MSRKPVAKILVLDGPTHYGLPLPVAGRTDFMPRTKVPIYNAEDLAAAQRLLPSGQIKVRVFPRIEDAPDTVSQPQPETPVVPKPAQKGGRRR